VKAYAHLKPGQNGTKRLLEQYGKALLCVRYRFDETRGVKLKRWSLLCINMFSTETKYRQLSLMTGIKNQHFPCTKDEFVAFFDWLLTTSTKFQKPLHGCFKRPLSSELEEFETSKDPEKQ